MRFAADEAQAVEPLRPERRPGGAGVGSRGPLDAARGDRSAGGEVGEQRQQQHGARVRERSDAPREPPPALGEEAKFLATSQAVNWALFVTGEQRRLTPPEEAVERAKTLTPQQQQVIAHQGALWMVGSAERMAEEIAQKAREAQADEVMITTTIHSYELRRRSFALLAAALGIAPR